MFNITQVNNKINIDSEGIDFRITGSLVSGTSLVVANIEAIGYDWDVSYSGTMVNVKLILPTFFNANCVRTQTDADFAMPVDYTAPLSASGTFLLLSGTYVHGFTGQDDDVYFAASSSVKRIPYIGGTAESKSYSYEDYRHFIVTTNGEVIVESLDVNDNYVMLLKDFGGDIGDKTLYTISGKSGLYYKTLGGMCLTPNGRIVTFLYNNDTVLGQWVVEVHVHQYPSGTELMSWTLPIYTNYNIQTWQAAPVLVGNSVYWGVGWLAAYTATSASTGIVLKVDTSALSVSYVRPVNGSYCSGALYCSAYDATLGKVAFIFDSVVGVSGSREAGIFLVNSALNYSIEHLQAYTYPTYVAGVPQGLIQGETEAFVLHHDGFIISLSSLNQTTITGGLTNMQYAMPRYCCNIVDENGFIWAINGSGGSLSSYSVLGGGTVSTGISFPAGILYVYLNNGKILVRNATAGSYRLWVII